MRCLCAWQLCLTVEHESNAVFVRLSGYAPCYHALTVEQGKQCAVCVPDDYA